MTEIIEFTNKDFKTAVIIILENLKENINIMIKELIQKLPNGISRDEKHI